MPSTLRHTETCLAHCVFFRLVHSIIGPTTYGSTLSHTPCLLTVVYLPDLCSKCAWGITDSASN